MYDNVFAVCLNIEKETFSLRTSELKFLRIQTFIVQRKYILFVPVHSLCWNTVILSSKPQVFNFSFQYVWRSSSSTRRRRFN